MAGIHTVSIETGEPDDPRWRRFAMRVCLGASITSASRHAGVDRDTGHRWLALSPVQRLVAEYNQLAVERARRELAGMVRGAVRTVRELQRDASPKGSPTRLAAAQFVLQLARIDVVPVAQQERRIVTFMPRPDRVADQPTGLASPDSPAPEPVAARSDLPRVRTPDGLPPDFPRLPDGAVDLDSQTTYYPPQARRSVRPHPEA